LTAHQLQAASDHLLLSVVELLKQRALLIIRNTLIGSDVVDPLSDLPARLLNPVDSLCEAQLFKIVLPQYLDTLNIPAVHGIPVVSSQFKQLISPSMYVPRSSRVETDP
jgi:hypothetical protein